jgi:hypothetical protein
MVAVGAVRLAGGSVFIEVCSRAIAPERERQEWGLASCLWGLLGCNGRGW